MRRNRVYFEGFRLDSAGLSRVDPFGRSEPVVLGARAFDLLSLLVDRRGEVVPKEAIMQAVWPGLAIEDGNLTVQISTLRRVLDRDRATGSCIQTIAGRGYRFLLPVSEVENSDAQKAAKIALPSKPSIAVLPFENLSGDPEQDYFADGMVEEIITALSRIRWLFVIARNSSFSYKGQAVDIKRVGEELGVHYVLEGSVRKASDRVRITVQLIETATGAHLWSEHFDSPLRDVFELQDNVAASVAGAIEPTLQAAEVHRSSGRATGDVTAYDLYLRALPHLAARQKERLFEALTLLREAIDRDPQCGPALAEAAQCHFEFDLNGWTEDREANLRTGLALAHRALHAAPNDPDVIANVAFVMAYFGEDIDAATALIDRALVLNPSCARGWYWSGVLRNWIGRPDLAVNYFETCLRLSPRGQFAYYLTGYGIALFFARRFEDAATKLLESLAQQPDYVLSLRFLAASYAHLGKVEETKSTIRRLRMITTALIDNGSRYRKNELREIYLSGLRRAVDIAESA
jgi:TolB-like protein